MIFVNLSDDSFVIAEFNTFSQYLFTISRFFRVILLSLTIVISLICFSLFCSNYRDLGGCCFHG